MTSWKGHQLIICNACIKSTLKSTSVRAARREAKEAGWRYIRRHSDGHGYLDGSMVDICADCWAKREKEERG